MTKAYIVWKQDSLYEQGYILNVYSGMEIAKQAYPKITEGLIKEFPAFWVDEYTIWDDPRV